jgi:hypothetical protein
MSSRFEQGRLADARAAQVAAQTDALKTWLDKKHPEIPNTDSSVKAFLDDMGDAFLRATEEDFEYSLRTMETNITTQRVSTEAEIKQELIQRILELIASKNGGRDGKYSALKVNGGSSELDMERTKISHWSIPQLTERLEEIVRKQTLAPKPVGELKRFVANAHADTRKYPGFPTLGKTIVRPGTVRAIALDANYIKGLDTYELRRIIRIYSAEQINARLAGRS